MASSSRYITTLLFIFFLLSGVSLPAQEDYDSLDGVRILQQPRYSAQDTVPVVLYNDKQPKATYPMPLIYLDGLLLHHIDLNTINPDSIQAIEVKKDDPSDPAIGQRGAIYITTHENYHPKIVSLTTILTSYVDTDKDLPHLLLINGKPVQHAYDDYYIDEKYILKVEVTYVKQADQLLDLYVIDLITRTEANLKEANTIYIR